MQPIIQNKYCLKAKMNSLTREEYKIAIRTLPVALNITQRTFYRYLNTSILEEYSMPVDDLARLARFFNCRIEDLLNYEPAPLSTKRLKIKGNSDLLQKFKLVK